jgi:hypothetical protein
MVAILSGIARRAAVGIGARVLLAPAELGSVGQVIAGTRASFPVLSTRLGPRLQHTPLSHSVG